MTESTFRLDKKYKIIYADPPWEYDDKLRHHGGSSESHYKTMTIDEICALPVKQIRDENSILFIWGTWPNLPWCLQVIESWGFQYKTIGFVWNKEYSNGRKVLGMGRYTRGNTEFCLIGVYGKPQRIRNDISQLETTLETEHSEKPDIFRKRITELMGDLPRIELFARTRVHGWDVWGNDPNLQAQPLEEFIR